MTITLITACYNSVATIRTALESVLRQTWPELEYLVIDGGSTDGTVDLIREFEPKFGGRMRWVSEPDKGLYDALNKGIRMATGEVVGILNADDVLADDGVIERVASAFVVNSKPLAVNGKPLAVNGKSLAVNRKPLTVSGEQSTENRKSGDDGQQLTVHGLRLTGVPDAVYGDIRFVANKTDIGLDALREEKTVRYYSSRLFRPWLARFGYMPAHPSFYCRRELFEKLGYYQADYKIAADHELLIRFLVKERVCCVYLPAALVVMRVGGMSTRSVESTMILNRENIRACKANGIYTNRLMQLGKYLFKIPGLIFKGGY